MNKLFGWILIYLSLALAPAKAAQLVEEFDTRDNYGTGTAVWNQAYSVLHPTLRVMNFKAGFTALEFSVGDGSDGAFESGTYEKFSENGDVSGNIIRLNTDTHPILQVTRFDLAQGWFLVPVGSKPLIIYSQSYVFIQGEIWCNGEDGGDSSGTTPGTGGQGRCGGKSGGTGGAPTQAGQNGTDVSGSVTGGRGGHYAVGSFVGGGGGGAWNTSLAAQSGPNSTASGGQAGSSSADPEFTNELGSAGGGGGGGGNTTAGGGGGGGGGIVIIHSVGDVWIGDSGQTYGFIYAHGGNGGDADTGAGDAGPGGAGGGGSVQVFSGTTINIYNNTAGSSRATPGTGGTNSSAATGANGGRGRSWFAAVNTNYVGSFLPASQAPVTGGNVEYNPTTQTIETASLDLGNTLATVTALDMNPVSADFVLEVAGSDDNFSSDNTGWTTNLALLKEHRFVKFRVSITTSDVNTPTLFSSATITYDPGQRNEFDFKAAGCGVINAPPPPPMNTLLLFLLPLILFAILKIKAEARSTRHS